MKIGLKVKYVDGTERDVNAVFADFVAFERTWSRSVSRFETEVRITDLAWLAWNVETRSKNTDKKFDPDWILTVENVEVAEVEGDTPLATTA
jgi:hypothetical protein